MRCLSFVVGRWLLVIACRLWVVGCQLLFACWCVIVSWLFVVCFVCRGLSVVARCPLCVVCVLLCVVRCVL